MTVVKGCAAHPEDALPCAYATHSIEVWATSQIVDHELRGQTQVFQVTGVFGKEFCQPAIHPSLSQLEATQQGWTDDGIEVGPGNKAPKTRYKGTHVVPVVYHLIFLLPHHQTPPQRFRRALRTTFCKSHFKMQTYITNMTVLSSILYQIGANGQTTME